MEGVNTCSIIYVIAWLACFLRGFRVYEFALSSFLTGKSFHLFMDWLRIKA